VRKRAPKSLTTVAAFVGGVSGGPACSDGLGRPPEGQHATEREVFHAGREEGPENYRIGSVAGSTGPS